MYKPVSIVALTALFLFLVTIGNAQTKPAAKKSRQKTRSFDSRSIRPYSYYLDSAQFYVQTNPIKALEQLSFALEEAITNKDNARQALVYLTVGKAYANSQNHDLATNNFEKGIALLKKRKEDPQLIASLYLEAANSYLLLKEFKSASKNIDQYCKINLDAQCMTTKGDLFFEQKEYQKSLMEYQTLLRYYEAKNDKKGVQIATEKIGLVFQTLQQEEVALDFYKISKSTAEELEDDEAISSSNQKISSVYRAQGNKMEELNIQQEEVGRARAKNDSSSVRKANQNIADLYLEDNNEEQAIPLLEENLSLADNSTEGLEDKKAAFKSLSSAYEKKGEFDKALLNFQNYVAIMDTLYASKQRQIDSASALQKDLFSSNQRLDAMEKDKKITETELLVMQQEQALFNEKLQQQRLINYGLLGLISIVLVSAYLLFKNVQQKKTANQMLALKSLRSQMNPHFIFNALNSVNGFIAQNDQKEANKYLSDFSRLMRNVLENSQKEFIPLATEIQMLQLYMKLEHFRFKEKFEYEFIVDQELNLEQFDLPPMLIQPYIENAVWHGLRYVENKGFLKIHFFEKDKKLQVLIEDNGIGRTASKALKTKNQKQNISTGLKNTNNRVSIINDMYGSKLSIKIEDRNKEEKTGTRVKITIPYRITDTI